MDLQCISEMLQYFQMQDLQYRVEMRKYNGLEKTG